MAFANKSLAQGQLTNSPADILAPSGKQYLVHNVTIYNSTVGDIIVTVSRYDGASTRISHKLNIASYNTVDLTIPSEGWVIEDGHKLIMQSDTATSANYFIDGTEETP